MFGVFPKIQEICCHMGTRISKIAWEMSEIIKPKVGNPKISVSRNWAILSYPWNLIFLRMRFSNFFLNYMVWKYQNEIAPIFYYGISTKTNEKDIKISKLQPPDWKSPYWMTLYIEEKIVKIRLSSLTWWSWTRRTWWRRTSSWTSWTASPSSTPRWRCSSPARAR